MERVSGPDRLKGLLLVLVVFGHTIPESVTGSFTKWLIYGVHMPAFLFLSGYLISIDSLRRRTFARFVRHYWRRLLLPWLAVSLVWGETFGHFDISHPGRSFADLVLHPQWHLWYIPVLLAMLTLAWVAVRVDRPVLILGLLLCRSRWGPSPTSPPTGSPMLTAASAAPWSPGWPTSASSSSTAVCF